MPAHKNLYLQISGIILAVSFLNGLSAFMAAGQAVASGEKAPEFSAKLEEIEKKIEARRQELGIPGVGLAIVKAGKVIYLHGFGYKDLENKVPVTPDTQFTIGSSTKAFTALSVLMSQDDSKLSIDDSPKKYLPYFKINDLETDKNIKIRDLMTHSSGLSATDLSWMSGLLTREEIIRAAGEAKPTAKLHERFQYQNVMFTTAGEIVAQAQKMPWEKFVAERIFKPLSMNNSNVSITEMQAAKDYSFGYGYNPDGQSMHREPFIEAGQVSPAGSINSSARDMAKWLQFVLGGGEAGGRRLVSEKGFEEWTSPQMKINAVSSYGFGWFLQSWKGLKMRQHGGNINGFNAMVSMLPEKQIGFVMLTNVTNSSLSTDLMPIIYDGLLDSAELPAAPVAAAKPANPSLVASTPAAKELFGKYASAGGKSAAEISESGGKVFFTITGRQPNELRQKQKDLYELNPLPEPFALKVNRSAEGQIESFTIIQPQSEVLFTRAAPTEELPKITADELMAKAIDALGGAEAMKKISSRTIKYDFDFENQGLKGSGVVYAKAPNLTSSTTAITAFGKTLLESSDYFDGRLGGERSSIGAPRSYSGARLEDVKISSDFYGLLNWKSAYQTAEIKGIEKIGDENAYAIALHPEKASDVIYYISTATFLPVRKTTLIASGNIKVPVSEDYSDYRPVDGVKLPFKTVADDPSLGRTISLIKSVEDNTDVSASLFQPREQ